MKCSLLCSFLLMRLTPVFPWIFMLQFTPSKGESLVQFKCLNLQQHGKKTSESHSFSICFLSAVKLKHKDVHSDYLYFWKRSNTFTFCVLTIPQITVNLIALHNSEAIQTLISTTILQNRKRISIVRILLLLLNLLQLCFHPVCPHDGGHDSAQEENASVDEASHSGILTVGTATAQ